MDYTRLNDQLTFDPRLSLTYLVTEGTSLKGAAGVHHQPPNPDELDPIFGNPDLENEQALSFSLGIEQALPWGIQVDVTAFHKRLTNVIAISDEPGENYHNEGIGRVSGLEVFGRRALSNGLFAWLSYTLMKAERKDGPDKPWRHFDFDQTHILTAAVSAEVGAGWIAGFRLRWVTGNPWTPQMPGVFDSDGDVNVPALGDHGAIRLPDYFSLDVRVDKKWEFTSWELSVYVDVWNATNRANAEGLIYNHDHTESTPLQSLPIFPSLGMRAEL
jgi:outer membrane receptor protein involved in Fe transport